MIKGLWLIFVGPEALEQTRVHKDALSCFILLFSRQIIIQNESVLNEFALGVPFTEPWYYLESHPDKDRWD